MRVALCTQDGVTYEAVDFNQTTDFITKKRFLECPECHGPAFYRGLTRNGREACFGARPHIPGCTLATLEHDGEATGQGNEEDELLTIGQRIVLDFNFGTAEAGQGGQPAGVPIATGNAGTHGDNGPAVRETITRRLGPLLRSLIELDEFRRSPQIIEVPEIGEFSVADFFVNFTDVTDDHIGSYHGFWGMVPDARRAANGTLWFNSGGREDMSALLDKSFIEETCQRFHVENEEDIAGAYILVLGELRLAKNGKKYVQIDDPYRFTLRLAR